MEITFTHNGRLHQNWPVDAARDANIPNAVIGAALKEIALGEVAAFAENCRAKVATQTTGKSAEYRIKEEVARDPDGASEAELDMLSREAKARGTNRTGLIGQIKARSTAFREVALLIGALEAEAATEITLIADDDGDIETKIQTTLGAAKSQADTAFTEALALISGS